MKLFWVKVLSCLMISSFLASCASALPEHQRGAATKMGVPRQAQEEVVPSQAPGAVVPQEGTSQSK